MRKFLLKTVMYILLITGGYELLFRAGYLPIVTDSTYFDHKMAWIQRHPFKGADFAVVGSSVPLYGVESSQMVSHLPMSYYNFSSWNVKVTECRMIVESVVREYRPKYVLIGSSLGDFCRRTDSTYRNYTEATPFVRRQLPEVFYAVDYHSIHQIVYRHFKVNHVNFDPWGMGYWAFDKAALVGLPADNVGEATIANLPYDPEYISMHYRALDTMSRWLRDQRVQMIFVQFPILAKSMADSADRARVERHIRTCDSIISRNGGIFLNYCDSLKGPDTLFAGSIHLRPPGAKVFTGKLVRDLEKIIGKNE